MDGLLKGPDVHPVNGKVKTSEIDDVVDGEFLLEEVGCDGGVRENRWEKEFEPKDWAGYLVDCALTSFLEAGDLALMVVLDHEVFVGFVIPD